MNYKLIIQQVWLHIGLMWDQVLNSLWLGHLDETVSSRLGRAIGRERYFWVRWLRLFVDFLFLWHGPDHCKANVLSYGYGHEWKYYGDELWGWTKEQDEKISFTEKTIAFCIFMGINVAIIYSMIWVFR